VKPTTLKGRLLSAVSHALHRFALKRPELIFVQNHDDAALLQELRMIPAQTPVRVCAGSGVNVHEFRHVPMAEDANLGAGRMRFVLVSRLLLSKGVAIFAEAARSIKQRYPQAEFHLVGPFDPNPNRVTEEQVEGWVKDGVITYHGMVKDVASLLGTMHVFCLPTWYREGVPHASLEALSMGKAIITTDSVGARECIHQPEPASTAESSHGNRVGLNGILIPTQSIPAMVEAIEHYLLHPQQIHNHGQESRKLAEQVFDVRIVNALILREMHLE
jgi:glycosyltransferase involved in cell wall biosynthesis